MNRILTISVIILAIAFCVASFIAVHRGNTIDRQTAKIDSLTENVETLIKGREKDYADKVELAKRNEELEAEAAKDNNCFTWNTDISHSPIVQRLRQD
jgi:uncharacterized protein YoxC